MTSPIEIRGLDGLRKRFAALGELKDLQPALRTEAEAVAEEARARLTEHNPNSRLAQSIKIMELATGDLCGRDRRSGGIFRGVRHPDARLALACPSFARSFTWN